MVLSQGWLGLDWGNVPTWVGAVLTGSSLLIAANTYRRAVQDRRREQASKFAAWVSGTPAVGRVQLFLANGSDMPVYKVRVDLIVDGDRSSVKSEHIDVAPPGRLPARDL